MIKRRNITKATNSTLQLDLYYYYSAPYSDVRAHGDVRDWYGPLCQRLWLVDFPIHANVNMQKYTRRASLLMEKGEDI